MAKGSKWAMLRDQFPKLPLDGDYQSKIDAVLNAPPPIQDVIDAGADHGDKALRLWPIDQVVALYNSYRDRLQALADEVAALNLKLEATEFRICEHYEANDLLTQKFADGSSITVAPDPVVSVADEFNFYGWVKDDAQRVADFKLREYINPQTCKSQIKRMLEGGEPLPPGIDVFYLNRLTRRSG